MAQDGEMSLVVIPFFNEEAARAARERIQKNSKLKYVGNVVNVNVDEWNELMKKKVK